jgi:cysteine desulfuration protein SufE
MTRAIAEELEELAEEFDLLDDWQEQLGYVIDLGRGLDPLTDEERTDANKVRGCASQVWVISRRLPGGRLEFRADSDAQIPKGLIAVLLRLYSGRRPEEIAALDPQVAVDRLRLGHMLTSQRANGLAAMVDRIRREAAAASAA